MTLTPGLRKLALWAHVGSSVGWLGAAGAYLALAVAAVTSRDARILRAAYLAIEPIAWFALVPLALASLLTGLVSSLGTTWGLFRHYWVLFKLLLTVVATAILLMNMSTVSFLAGAAAGTETVGPGGLRGQILHAGGGVLVLLVAMTLGLYKPRGITPYGQRMQDRSAGGESSEDAATRGTPRWVKVFAAILAAVVLAIGVRLVAGHLAGHGPPGH